MQCKSCHAELAKHAKVCPKCGAKAKKQAFTNTKVIAIFGVCLTFIGGLLPFVQDIDPTNSVVKASTDSIEYAYSFMNIQQTAYWYLFMIALVVSIVLIAIKKEKLSIISTTISFQNNYRIWTISLQLFFTCPIVIFVMKFDSSIEHKLGLSLPTRNILMTHIHRLHNNNEQTNTILVNAERLPEPSTNNKKIKAIIKRKNW